MKEIFAWEKINKWDGDVTERAKVFGGWIVRNLIFDEFGNKNAMVFVPDNRHDWNV